MDAEHALLEYSSIKICRKKSSIHCSKICIEMKDNMDAAYTVRKV